MVGLINMPGSEEIDHSTPEEGRGFRQKKKFAANGPRCCPVCEVTIRPGECDAHLSQELNRLNKLSDSNRLQRRMLAENQGSSRSTNGSPMTDQVVNRFVRRGASTDILEGGATTSGSPQREATLIDSNPDKRRDAYLQIKSNRQGRLRIKKGNKRKLDETVCPICSERIQGTAQELNNHVDMCLRRRDGTVDEDIDVEDTFEEYEWAGQQRVRTSTLLDGGLAGAGMATVNNRSSPADEDVDLVVDVVDSNMYGPPQYSEADIVLPMADGPDEEKDRAALRAAVINPTLSSYVTVKASPVNRKTFPVNEETSSAKNESSLSTEEQSASGVEVKWAPSTSSHQLSNAVPSNSNTVFVEAMDVETASNTCSSHIMEALKERIKELESDSRSRDTDSFKCLICMERYMNPVISVCCWHVHCEACWLHTLGAKKLCPQCNMITSPSDLRKIYI